MTIIIIGYRSSQFHHNPDAVKTDAPPKVVWDVIRAFAKITPPVGIIIIIIIYYLLLSLSSTLSGSSHKKTSEAAKAILQKELTREIGNNNQNIKY